MKLSLILLLPVCALLAAFIAGRSVITFEDIAKPAGIRFSIQNSPTPQKYQAEPMVAGVAIFDYDGDGLADIYFVNGGDMPALTRNGPQFSNRLFHNDGNLKFTDVTDKAGVAGSGYGMGVAIGDYDNDGRPDIFLASLTGNQLFHNNGNGTFSEVTQHAGLTGGLFAGRKMWSVAAAWVDYNNDGLLDLFVTNYCQWSPETNPKCEVNGHRMYCSPKYFKTLPNSLYRNNGDGTFSDVSEETGIAKTSGRNMGVAVADYDGDGYSDLFVANDAFPNKLFHNVKGKAFEEVAEDSLVAYAEDGNAISGMGVDFKDVFNKGLPSIWVTALEQQTFPLFENLGHGQFADASDRSGIALETAHMAGWGNAILDLDNDGWKDLLVARSNVTDNIELFAPRKYEEPNSVFQNLANGRFANTSSAAGPAFQRSAAWRGVAYGDLDNDGRLDAVFSALNSDAQVLHNTTRNANHWLLIKLTGTLSNRMGLGARIRVASASGTQFNHATTSTGYASSSDPRVHFGLGSDSRISEIEIIWPSGIHQLFHDVAADQILAITETRK